MGRRWTEPLNRPERTGTAARLAKRSGRRGSGELAGWRVGRAGESTPVCGARCVSGRPRAARTGCLHGCLASWPWSAWRPRGLHVPGSRASWPAQGNSPQRPGQPVIPIAVQSRRQHRNTLNGSSTHSMPTHGSPVRTTGCGAAPPCGGVVGRRKNSDGGAPDRVQRPRPGRRTRKSVCGPPYEQRGDANCVALVRGAARGARRAGARCAAASAPAVLHRHAGARR